MARRQGLMEKFNLASTSRFECVTRMRKSRSRRKRKEEQKYLIFSGEIPRTHSSSESHPKPTRADPNLEAYQSKSTNQAREEGMRAQNNIPLAPATKRPLLWLLTFEIRTLDFFARKSPRSWRDLAEKRAISARRLFLWMVGV